MTSLQAPGQVLPSNQSWIIRLPYRTWEQLQKLFPLAPTHQPTQSVLPSQHPRPATPTEVAGIPLANAEEAIFHGYKAYRNIGTYYSVPLMPIDDASQKEWERISESLFDDFKKLREDMCLATLCMVGSRADRLEPTIVIGCWNNEDCKTLQGREMVRKRVRKAAKRFESLRGCSLGYKVAAAEIDLLAQYSASGTAPRPETASIEAHIPKGALTLCGVPLRLVGQTGQVIDFCTLGGVLYLKGHVYGLTAGHPFEQTLKADSDDCQELDGLLAEDVVSREQSDSEDSAFEDYEVERSGASLPTVTRKHLKVGSDTENKNSTPFKKLGTLSERPNREKCNGDWALIDINDCGSVLPNLYFSPRNNVVIVIDGSMEKTCPRGAPVTLLTAVSGTIQGKIGQPHGIMRQGKWHFEVSQVIISKPLGMLKNLLRAVTIAHCVN
jgi:hypothetical protein